MPVRLSQHMLGKWRTEFRESEANCLQVGLVNNMTGTALENTERQFHALLDSAADGIDVRLTLLSLPDIPRTEMCRRRINSFYTDVNDLWTGRVDGLIVTGTEPRNQNLRDEPYWASLTRLIEWAGENTYSSVWSCLAAHAALLHSDGIVRRPLSEKRFGVFECTRVSDHPLMAGLPARLNIPHSRWNEVQEDRVRASGYHNLTKSEDAGVDAFIKYTKSLFVYFQGHPEYDRETLLLEYRRDVGRFLRGERESYPPMPDRYFDTTTVSKLAALQKRAVTDRRETLIQEFPGEGEAGVVGNTWSPAATGIYRNWLCYLSAQKSRWLRGRRGRRQFTTVTTSAPQEIVQI